MLKVLLAEDNEINQKVFLHMVKRRELEVDVAIDGHQALDKLLTHTYDLVFMDIQMPHMDGKQVTLKLRSTEGPNKSTPVVALTAYAMQSDVEECLSLGMNAYLSKPINKAELYDFLDHWEENTK